MKRAILFIGYLAVLLMACSAVMAATLIIRPDSQGVYSDWNTVWCTNVSAWNCVDESTVNTSDYLYTNLANKKVTFGFSDVNLTTEKIRSLALYYYGKYYGSSNYYISSLLRINGSDYNSSGIFLSSAYGWVNKAFTTNPSTGMAWTVSDLNALEAGMKTWSSYYGGYVAAVYGAVNYDNPSTLADLAVNNLTYSYYWSGNTTVLMVGVNALINNIGGNDADTSVTQIVGLNSTNASTGYIASGSSGYVWFSYPCTGAHIVTVTADITDNITEANESNNAKSTYISCEVFPDLYIGTISLSKSIAYDGENVSVGTLSYNIGLGYANNSTTRLSYQGINLSFDVKGLNSYGSQYDYINYTCNSPTSTVVVNFSAIADYGYVVNESNENNNQRSTILECRARADLVISNLTFFEYNKVINGTNYTYANVTTTVKNIGLGSSVSSTTRLAALSNFSYSTGVLAPSATAKYSTEYLCTAAHTAYAYADVLNTVLETNEGNNQNSAYIDCII